MRIHLSTPAFDIEGAISFDVLPTSDMGSTARRTNRVATLDGGAVLNDYGFSEGDRTIDLRWRTLSRPDEAAVVRLVKLYGQLNLSTSDGLFRVAPETYKNTANESSLTLLVLEKL